jgi:O-antigen/teichoic acid export membrane protein
MRSGGESRRPRRESLVLDRPTARRALRFGLPSAVVAIGLWTVKTSDRLILQHFTSLTVVALYSVTCSVSKIAFDIVGNAVNWAVVPFVYATLKRDPEHRAKSILARLATYNVAVLVALGLATVLYARELIHVLASATYAEAASVVPLVAAASMVQLLNSIPSSGISYRERTFYFPVIVGTGAAVSLTLNFSLIPSLGMQGAAIAMLVGQTACVALTLPISQRLYRIPYEWGRLVRLLLAAVATIVAVWLVPDTSPLLYQAIKAVLLLVFPGLLLVIGFFTDDEIRAAHTAG